MDGVYQAAKKVGRDGYEQSPSAFLIVFPHVPASLEGPVAIHDKIHMVSLVASSKRRHFIFRLLNLQGEEEVEGEFGATETTSEVIMKLTERSLILGCTCHRFLLEGTTRVLNYESSPDILRGTIGDFAKTLKEGTTIQERETPAGPKEAASSSKREVIKKPKASSSQKQVAKKPKVAKRPAGSV